MAEIIISVASQSWAQQIDTLPTRHQLRQVVDRVQDRVETGYPELRGKRWLLRLGPFETAEEMIATVRALVAE